MKPDHAKQDVVIQPEGELRLGDFLKQSFADGQWKEFRAAIAFVKYSGTKHIRQSLADFAQRASVKMRIGTSIVDVNMMTWPDKHDFRLRSEHLRSAGGIGDILYLERSDGMSGFTYYVEVIPQGSARYSHYLAQCVNPVRNSKRLWGYI